ncbi:MAG: hypothetical protein WKG01_19995 [Kofleriaceae bacterium]
MQSSSILGLVTSSLIAVTASADPRPTTQACLGDFKTFLTCPSGAKVNGTECRGSSGHWSGSSRQGPSLFLRDRSTTDPAKVRVNFAANYVNHKKTGRVFHFDKDGRLESWTDTDGDRYHGLSVNCRADGRVAHLAYYKQDKVVGISRAWLEKDGTLSYAMDHDAQGKSIPIANPSAALIQRPDQLCQPTRCDVTAKPDLSGVPR